MPRSPGGSKQWGAPVHRPVSDLYDQSYLAGVQLSRALAAGWRPPAQPANIALAAGEQVYGQAPTHILEYAEQQVSYTRGAFVAFGNPLLTVATVAGSVAYNARQKSKAQAQAAAQWRHADTGQLFCTQRRIALMGRAGWFDIYYPALRTSTVDIDGLIVMMDGCSPVKLQVWPQHWFYGLLRFFAYGEIVPYREEDIPAHLLPQAHRPDRPALE
jgi:hypothetical protein